MAAQQRADEARAKLEKATRDSKVRLRFTAVIMMTAALVRLAWEAMNAQAPAVTSSIERQITQTTASIVARTSERQSEAGAAFDRLRDAFHSFPEEDQPAVVREVNSRYAGTEFTCPLEWNEGRPKLSLKDQSRNQLMMAEALNQCASGVERLRREKDAELTSK